MVTPEPVVVGGRPVGPGHPPLLVAEAGVNHDGDVSMARDLVDAACEAGAEAVKFQTFTPEKLASPEAPKADYQAEATDDASQREMLADLALPPEAYEELANYARKRGILFLSSPFDPEAVALLDGLDVPAVKVPSGEITNLPYLEAVAQTGRPTILSTGMSTLGEVERAVETLEATEGGTIVLHCLSEYPAPPDEVNLRAMDTLRESFQLPVGFSDHTEGLTVPTAAVARGACLVEKHFTLDRTLPGPDHASSLEPDELADLAEAIATAYEALGTGRKQPAPSEASNREVVRKSLALGRPLEAGSTVERSDLVTVRPATGIEPTELHRVVGGTLAVDKPARHPLRWEELR